MYPHRRRSDSGAYDLTHDGTVVGRLFAETPQTYRLSILDRRFALLDGSHFFSTGAATSAVSRLARFVAVPQRDGEIARRKQNFPDSERFFVDCSHRVPETSLSGRW